MAKEAQTALNYCPEGLHGIHAFDRHPAERVQCLDVELNWGKCRSSESLLMALHHFVPTCEKFSIRGFRFISLQFRFALETVRLNQ